MKVAALVAVCERLRYRAQAIPNGPYVAGLILAGYKRPYLVARPEKVGVRMDDSSVGIDMYLFEPTTLEPYKLDPFFQPSQMLRHVHIPVVPSHVIWTFRNRARVRWAVLGPSSDPATDRAIQFAKFISFKLSGRVMGKTVANYLVQYYRGFFVNTPMRFESKLVFTLLCASNGAS